MKKRNVLIVGTPLLAALAAFTGVFEGNKNYVYLDPVGKKTWCSGESNDSLGKTIAVGKTYFTDSECKLLLERSLQKHNAPLEKLNYDLTDGQHIAFADITYNIGVSKFEKSGMYKLLLAGNPSYACDEILKWRYMAGKDCSIKENKCAGIWTRRSTEKQVCKGEITVTEFLQKAGKLQKGGDEK